MVKSISLFADIEVRNSGFEYYQIQTLRNQCEFFTIHLKSTKANTDYHETEEEVPSTFSFHSLFNQLIEKVIS